ncbi:MAG: NOG1 family protein [Thermoplasmatota archaeon]
MFDVPTIMTPEEILNKAFSRANKIQVRDPNFRFRMQKLNMRKLSSASSTIDAVLERYVKAFPSFNNIPPFYMALIDLMFSLDQIKRSLGRIDGARKEILRISSKTARQIQRTSKPDYMALKLREGYGRISSLVYDLEKDLDFLSEVREGFKKLPSIPTKYPTAVIAGFPNVGKSRIIKELSTATPKVASYPFTTQELNVGYFEEGRTRYQLVDTPGLLDRPFEERNDIEKQGILALTLLTNVCVFVIDPTEHCGFPLKPQMELLQDLKKSVPNMDFIIVINKIDLDPPSASNSSLLDGEMKRHGRRILSVVRTSAMDGTGLDRLKEEVVGSLHVDEEIPWETPDP